MRYITLSKPSDEPHATLATQTTTLGASSTFHFSFSPVVARYTYTMGNIPNQSKNESVVTQVIT